MELLEVGRPCAADLDCPENQVCFLVNVTWVDRSQCLCNIYYGYSGPTCRVYLEEPNGVFLLVVGVLGVVCSLWFAYVSWQNVYHLFRVARRKAGLFKDPVFLSSAYFGVAALLLIVYCSLLLTFPLFPLQPTAPSDESTLYTEHVGQIFLSLALMLIAFGVITVSMGFIEMTAVLSPSRRRRIRALGIAYKVSFAGIVLGLVLARQIHLALLVAFPYIVILAVAYIVGLTLLTRKISQNRSRDTRKTDVAMASLRSAQRSIIFLNMALLLGIALGILWCISSFFVGWKVVTKPGQLTPSLTGAVLWLPAILAAASVMKDITSWRRVRVARQSQLGAAGGGPGGGAGSFRTRTNQAQGKKGSGGFSFAGALLSRMRLGPDESGEKHPRDREQQQNEDEDRIERTIEGDERMEGSSPSPQHHSHGGPSSAAAAAAAHGKVSNDEQGREVAAV